MIRVLFVDDEPNVLHAMRRSLHSMRNEWCMDFAPGGECMYVGPDSPEPQHWPPPDEQAGIPTATMTVEEASGVGKKYPLE